MVLNMHTDFHDVEIVVGDEIELIIDDSRLVKKGHRGIVIELHSMVNAIAIQNPRNKSDKYWLNCFTFKKLNPVVVSHMPNWF